MRAISWRHIALFALMTTYLALTPFAATHLDLARDMFVAQRLAHGEAFPWSGPILAATIHLGPVWYWLLALFLGASGSWLATLFLVALMGALQFPLAYLVGKTVQSRRAGLLWAALLLLPSWSTFEQVLPLHYQLTATIVLAFFLCVVRFIERPRRKYLVSSALLFVLALHAHPICITLAWVVVPLFVWAAIQKKSSWFDIGLSIVVALLPLVPYFVWDAQNGFADIHSGLNYLGNSEKTGSLSRMWPLLIATSVGGTQYWLATIADANQTLVDVAIVLLGIVGLVGVVIWLSLLRDRSRRWFVIASILFAIAALFTLSLIRSAAPFYMTTPLHIVLVGIVAFGLDAFATRGFGPVLRVGAASLAIVTFAMSTTSFARHQRVGDWPFAFFPMYDVTADAQPTHPFLLTPAFAMSSTGKFLCGETKPSVHGTLARNILFDYAMEMRLSCGRADVKIGGAESDREHWIGLPSSLAESIGAKSAHAIGPMSLFAARPVSDETSIDPPSTAIYPIYIPKVLPAARREFIVTLSPGERIAVSNLAFFVPDPEVSVSIGGSPIQPIATDAVTRVFDCDGCKALAKATVSVTSVDFGDVDIVVF